MHSWHTGIHPKTNYNRKPEDDVTRWAVVSFNSPRFTHIHTCGNYPPGEIAVDVIDATIRLDGEVVWDKGELIFAKRPDVVPLLDAFPGYEDAFEQIWSIGV